MTHLTSGGRAIEATDVALQGPGFDTFTPSSSRT